MAIFDKNTFVNMQVDIDQIGEAINEKKIVTPRLGGPFKSIPLVVDEAEQHITHTLQTLNFEAEAAIVDVINHNMTRGFSTETILREWKPDFNGARAKADDTKKIWRWELTSAVGVTPIIGNWLDTGLSELDQAAEFTKIKLDDFLQSANQIEQLQTLYVGAVLASGTNSSTQANWRKTTYIPVKSGERIFYNASCNSSACLIAAFDGNKIFLRNLTPLWASTVVSAKEGFVDIEDDVAFVILSFYYADSKSYSFSIRSKILNTKLIQDVGVMQEVWAGLGGQNLFDSTSATDNGYLLNNVFSVRDTWFVSDYIPVVGGEYYTANGARAAGASAGTSIHYYDERKEFISASVESYLAYVPFLIPANVSFIRINFAKSASKSIHATAVYRGNQVFDDVVREKTVQVMQGQKMSANHYNNKTLLTMGDSITDHHTTAFTYPPIVAMRLGMYLLDCAISGTRIRSAFARTAVATNENIALADIITIAHGTNDFKLETAIGSITDSPTPRATLDDSAYRANSNTTGTFYADYKGVIESILSINSTARIMLITPIRRSQPAENNTDTNDRGHKLVDYVNAVRSIGEYYGLAVLDNHNTSGFNHITMSQWTSDGLHPTKWAHENVLASKVTGFILSN